MRAEYWAILTAICWATGALFEKQGVKLGELSPVMGTTIRTTASFLFLLIISYPFWHQVKTAGTTSLSMVAIGGGIVAGGLGILFLYTGLKTGQLSTVLTVAFCLTPVFGAVLGALVLKEALSAIQLVGIDLCISGATLVSYFR